uniref:MYCBP associated protein n=1 Tax=Malurus cyaneus samueli TaxID=2593467 RepID=A0A8C5TPK8_9PASS
DAGRSPVRRQYLVRKYLPKEVTHLVAHPLHLRAPRGPLTFPGQKQFEDGSEEILPHHILGSLEEFRMEALARKNTQLADAIKIPCPDAIIAALKEEYEKERRKEKTHQSQLPEHRAFRNWTHNMAMRKKQEKHLGEILDKPENELLMNMSDNYRQIQEERDLIDRTLPALFPGKGYHVGSEFWNLPDKIGDDLTGLTLTLTRTECGYPEPVTHVGKPHTVQRETGKGTLQRGDSKEMGHSCGGSSSFPNEIGIAARVTFESLVSKKVESFLKVTNDGTAAIWFDWMRLPQQIPSRVTKGKKMPCFYFDTRPGVIVPGECRKFIFIFKSERAGVFSEPWEFRTHPQLLGGALLKVTLWGVAVYEDKLAGFREKLENELAARERAAVVRESLNELLDQIRTPERTPSPVDAYVTEEELFHRKNPELHYQHQVVQQLHELWRRHMPVFSELEEDLPLDQRSTAEYTEYQESTLEPPYTPSSATELPGGKYTLEEAPRERSIEEEEAGPSGWNLSLKDFKQAIMSIPGEREQEEALAQLNKAALQLCVKQRPPQSELLHPLCLQLWRRVIDDLVSHSVRLKSVFGLIEKDTYVQQVPEETEEVKHGEAKKGGKEASKKEEKKDKEGKKSRGAAGKEKVVGIGVPGQL